MATGGRLVKETLLRSVSLQEYNFPQGGSKAHSIINRRSTKPQRLRRGHGESWEGGGAWHPTVYIILRL